ncbi:MAG: 1-acyl-sn-glycerol-3-phosphate acyltransferase, partial [Rhodospirillales bacterium]
MTDETEFAINRSSYDWCVRAFGLVEKRLGLNITVHDHGHLFEKGHIFLFNHFARFETIVPPYIIHQATGKYCRSIADHDLFKISDGFGGFLRGVGAVPNDTPGLLPFLAAEILRGRKVVIFPEGGMIKDRSVVDDEGDFSIFSRAAEKRRKHHRGAAVLALTLDILKRRIVELEARGDNERLARWVKALGLEGRAELLARAHEPTLTVPANITFYPLRVRENVFSRAVKMFVKDLPKNVVEELLIEGNLLFKETDMDIRTSGPIQRRRKWRWWERTLLNRYFMKVRSLDDLFGLKDQAEGWAERMLARCMCEETLRIRDQYTRAMYQAITVNMSHLASLAITKLMEQGRMTVSHGEFHTIVYLALKNLQAVPGVHLHISLCCPDLYRGVIDGDSRELDRFFSTAGKAGLVGRTPGSYRFEDKLCEDFGFDEIRMENPIVVYANEAAPLEEVTQTVEAA